MRLTSWALAACCAFAIVSGLPAGLAPAGSLENSALAVRVVAPEPLRLHRRGDQAHSPTSSTASMTSLERWAATGTHVQRQAKGAGAGASASSGTTTREHAGHAGRSPTSPTKSSSDSETSFERLALQRHREDQQRRVKARLDAGAAGAAGAAGGGTSAAHGHDTATSAYHAPAGHHTDTQPRPTVADVRLDNLKRYRLVKTLQREVRIGQQASQYDRAREYESVWTKAVPSHTSQMAETKMRSAAEKRVLNGRPAWPESKNHNRDPPLAPTITREQLVQQHPHLQHYADAQVQMQQRNAKKRGRAWMASKKAGGSGPG